MAFQRLGQGVARHRRVAQRPGLGGLGQQLGPPRSGVDGRCGDERTQVALPEQRPRQPAQRRPLLLLHPSLEGDLPAQGLGQHRVGGVQPLGQPLLPRLGEEGLGLRFVGDAEARGHPALQRPLLEDGGALPAHQPYRATSC